MMFLSSGSKHDDVPKIGALALKVYRDDALRQTQELFLEGRQINALYICTEDELQTAEKKKRSWIASAHDLLEHLAHGSEAVDLFDEVAINVLKESAPIETQSEQFHNELNQRLERLRMIRHAIEESPEPPAATRRAAAPVPQPVPVPAPGGSSPAVAVPSPAEQTGVSPDSGTLDFIAEDAPAPAAKSSSGDVARQKAASSPTLSKTKIVLILCSRNGTARQALCRFANQMNLNFEIVDYNPDQPHGMIDQIYRHRDAKFAVVYWGEPAGREMPGSAHPERYAGFALGFALGRLGRGRVFIMGSTTTPPLPGFNRILVAQLDSGGGWQIQLARRMKSAGVDIDLNQLT